MVNRDSPHPFDASQAHPISPVSEPHFWRPDNSWAKWFEFVDFRSRNQSALGVIDWARGGKRQGAGRPRGPKGIAKEQRQAAREEELATKEAAREFVRQRVAVALGPLVDAQIKNALGLKYLVTRDKTTGKFIRVTEAMARAKRDMGENEETIEV